MTDIIMTTTAADIIINIFLYTVMRIYCISNINNLMLARSHILGTVFGRTVLIFEKV